MAYQLTQCLISLSVAGNGASSTHCVFTTSHQPPDDTNSVTEPMRTCDPVCSYAYSQSAAFTSVWWPQISQIFKQSPYLCGGICIRRCLCICVCVCMRVKPVVMQPCSLMSGLWHLMYYDACSVCPMGLGLLSASMEACPRLHTSHWISSHHKTSHHVTFTLSHSHNHFSFVFPHYLHCFHLSENSQTSFLYSFSFALMCLTHLLFSSSFFCPLHYKLSSFFLFCLSFSFLLCLSPCVLYPQSVSVPPLICSLASHQAN